MRAPGWPIAHTRVGLCRRRLGCQRVRAQSAGAHEVNEHSATQAAEPPRQSGAAGPIETIVLGSEDLEEACTQ